jgi:rod shape-determining protein MreD
MNRVFGINGTRFLVLLLVQVIICSNINFLGYINPYIYILFIFLFPIREDRMILLLSSFLIGMLVDMFLDSGGVHAAASVTLAYARPILLKTSFGMLYEHQSIKFSNTDVGSLISYISFGTIIHHIILFSLEVFNISNALLIIKKTLFSSIFTTVLCVVIIILFSQDKK